MITKAKQVINSILAFIKRLQIVIISLVILVLLGYALLQVSEAVNPTPSPETVNEVKLEQQAKRVNYDDEALLKIRELKNVQTEVTPPESEHSNNPFSSN